MERLLPANRLNGRESGASLVEVVVAVGIAAVVAYGVITMTTTFHAKERESETRDAITNALEQLAKTVRYEASKATTYWYNGRSSDITFCGLTLNYICGGSCTYDSGCGSMSIMQTKTSYAGTAANEVGTPTRFATSFLNKCRPLPAVYGGLDVSALHDECVANLTWCPAGSTIAVEMNRRDDTTATGTPLTSRTYPPYLAAGVTLSKRPVGPVGITMCFDRAYTIGGSTTNNWDDIRVIIRGGLIRKHRDASGAMVETVDVIKKSVAIPYNRTIAVRGQMEMITDGSDPSLTGSSAIITTGTSTETSP